jgi:hypothetical protein
MADLTATEPCCAPEQQATCRGAHPPELEHPLNAAGSVRIMLAP